MNQKNLTLICAVTALVLASLWVGHGAMVRDYEYLYYEGHYYAVTNEPAEPENIGQAIGQVEQFTDIPLWGRNQEWDSNAAPVGTPVFAYETQPPTKALVVPGKNRDRVAYVVFERRNRGG